MSDPTNVSGRKSEAPPSAGEACYRAALAAHAAGVAVLPVRADGSKMPALRTWKPYQTTLPSLAEIEAWFGTGTQSGIFVVAGPVSGDLEVFEVESEALGQAFAAAAQATGLGPLWERVTAGYCSASPRGGWHILWRCPEAGRSAALARRPKPDADRAHPGDTTEVLIEVRGAGGGAIEPPSNGRVHPDGGAYVQLAGAFATIQTISPEERAAWLTLARTFDEMPPPPPRKPPGRAPAQGDRPGDAYNATADVVALLEQHGWQTVYERNGTTYVRRPGKSHGISASVNHQGSGLLYVFSSSTAFEAGRSYDAFGAYVVLEHGGDFATATRALRREQFGAPPPPPPPNGNGASPPPPPGPPSAARPLGRPIIDAGDHDLERISGQAWAALAQANTPPQFFRLVDQAVRVARDDTGAVIQPLDPPRLRHELARCATWIRVDKQGAVKAASPPLPVVQDMLAFPALPLPPLARLVYAPIVARDGTLHTAPGYSPASRAYYAPADGFAPPPVPAAPTDEEVAWARSFMLHEFLGDFPFAGEADRAHAVALLLLPFVRDLIDGPTPLHMIESPTPGSGKGLLADVILWPALGRGPSIMTAGQDADEWRKRITAQLLTAPSAILIDNIVDPLDSGDLMAALTADVWTDRLLGASAMVRLPVRCAWLATANNPVLKVDVARRVVRIRLDAKVDRPWQRPETAFRHPHLRAWAETHREALTSAALLLAQAWLAAGSPPPRDRLGSYERWSVVLGGILAHAGIDGFLGNLEELYATADVEGEAWRSFVAAWFEAHGEAEVTAAILFGLAKDTDGLDFGTGSEQSQKSGFGKALAQQRDRVYAGKRVVATRTVKRARHYRLVDTQRVFGALG